MRFGRDSGFIFGNDGLVALNLGADHCSEHEWGIKGIRRSFGVTEEGYGVERRRIRAVPSFFQWISVGNAEGFWLATGSYMVKYKPEDLEYRGAAKTLWTGWSGDDLGAFSEDNKGKKRLRAVFDAIGRLDACIWLGGGGVFQNAGLVIGITSRLAKDVLAQWDQHDREREKLLADAKATGVEDRLTKAGLEWFALSPRREKDGSVVFWLNPMQQHKHNCGWFTVADLDAWIAGKGPVVMTAEQRRERGR